MILATLTLAVQLVNPGFERGLEGWQVEHHRGMRVYRADNRHYAVRQSAEGEVYVSMGWRARSGAPPGAASRLFQQIDARRYRGRTIRVSAQTKAPGFAHRNGSLRVSAGGAAARTAIRASEQWRRHYVQLRVPRDARTIEIAFQIEGTAAELSLDDVQLDVLRPVHASAPARGGPPRPDLWVAYAPGGSSGAAAADGVVTAGGLRSPVFALRIVPHGNGTLTADFLTPAGFDRRHVWGGDMREEGASDDPYSEARLREARLERALMHHRPVVRLQVDEEGRAQVQGSPQLRRHEFCARQLLGAAIQAQMAAAKNEEQRAHQRERLQQDPVGAVSPRGDTAALLLRIAELPLPTAHPDIAGHWRDDGVTGAAPNHQDWRLAQIRAHGRPVRLQLDLLSAASSPAAGICRTLAYSTISGLRSDTCTIEGVIDQRDGWPITMTISRRGEAGNGATETQSRSFDRVMPLQGFIPPANPCTGRR